MKCPVPISPCKILCRLGASPSDRPDGGMAGLPMEPPLGGVWSGGLGLGCGKRSSNTNDLPVKTVRITTEDFRIARELIPF